MDVTELKAWYTVVLEDALRQAERGQQPEIDWVFSDRDSGPFSFLTIAKVLQMNPDRIRYTLRRCLKVSSLNNPITLELSNLETPDTEIELKKQK